MSKDQNISEMLPYPKRLSNPPKHVEPSMDPGPVFCAEGGHGSDRYLDVRYLKSLMNFKQALGAADCNESICPAIKRRLHNHKVQSGHAIPENPQDLSSDDNRHSPVPNTEDPVFVTPSYASLEESLRKMSEHDAQVPQTTIASTDMEVFDDSAMNHYDNSLNTYNKVVTSIETATELPVQSSYRAELYAVITEWVRDLTITCKLDTRNKEIIENLTNNLIEYIFGLANANNLIDYEGNVKSEIEEFLKMFSGIVHNEQEFTGAVSDNLWTQIEYLNRKYLSNTLEKQAIGALGERQSKDELLISNKEQYSIDNRFYYENCFENEITSWLDTHLDDQIFNKTHIAELLNRRLEPLLFSESMCSPKYKLILKGEIFEVLYDLSLFAQGERNRIIYLNKCAEDLANKLLSVRINYDNTYFNSVSNDLSVNHTITSPLVILQKCKTNAIKDIEKDIAGAYFESNYYANRNTPNNFVKDVIQQVSGTFIPELFGVVPIYTSHASPITSTPKKAIAVNVPKLNREETAYMNNVAGLVRNWMATFPKNYDDDKNYKDTIIYDLAGDIMDDVKLKQLTPGTTKDDDKQWIYLIRRWLYRFSIFEDLRDPKIIPIIDDFINNLKKLPIPKLTNPQHGNRQAMQNIKHMHTRKWEDDFVPQGIDVLEDQISVWMNDQPSNVFENKNKNIRNKQVHDLALNLQDRLRNKNTDDEMINDIQQWLRQVINPEEKEHIGILAVNLQDRIKNTPQDETLERVAQEQQRYRRDCYETKHNPSAAPVNQDIFENEKDFDKTIKDIINKFMDYNYDIDDPLARGAFGYSLKKEIRKLSPLTRKELHENSGKSTNHPAFPPPNLSSELEYIKIISDWLKNIPIDASFNTVGSTQRIEYVSDLAKSIAEIEDKRLEDSTAMDYDIYIESLITDSFWMYAVPILPEYKKNKNLMAKQLVTKIIASRPHVDAAREEHDSSIIVDADNAEILDIGKFIEEYVRINAVEIGDDELKAQAWSARLLKEIKKMVHVNDSPHNLKKMQMYDKFADVAIPCDVCVKRFQLELEYIKEISEWLKNLPLEPMTSHESEQKRVNLINDLAEFMSERIDSKLQNPADKNIDENAAVYIKDWISRLPLYHEKEVVYPIVIQQLLNRIDKISGLKHEDISEHDRNSTKSLTNRPKVKLINDKTPCCSEIKSLPDPGKHIVDTIEQWCAELPIEGENEFVKTMKDNIAKRMYQKISALNMDPRIFNDDLMYLEMLEDEIDTQFENIPQTTELQDKRESLRNKLISTILKAKNVAKAKSAGENYKHKLETTIDTSIPNPSQTNHNVDPGFELYKKHLADIFILENFDHGNDSIKLNYENKIKAEVDKYFKNALERNAVPLSKEEIYNNLYGALFKVPIPCKQILADEVEKIKTRCEIETWFEELPLREAEGLHELLEWERIVEVLSKRLYDLEKTESKPEEKMQKEITKWLNQLPLLDNEKSNIDDHAKKLQELLKATASKRKCVKIEPKTKDKSKIKKSKTILETSQKLGPNNDKNTVIPPDSFEPKPCNTCIVHKKPADCVMELIGEWCENLPLLVDIQEAKMIKENISKDLMLRIAELNSNPEYFENDFLYYELLDEHLEKILNDLPTSTDFQGSIPARKYQFKEMLATTKPFIKHEKERYTYKEKLRNLILDVLKVPLNVGHDKMELFNDLRDEILDYFFLYRYNHDPQDRQIYKNNVHDTLSKYIDEVKDKNAERCDSLILCNLLLCELSKIPISENILTEIVEEVKMKQDLDIFFQDISIPKGSLALIKQMKSSLSKRLRDLERSGSPYNDQMKTEINKCLKKLNVTAKPGVVETFVNTLKATETSRKVPAPVLESMQGQVHSHLSPGAIINTSSSLATYMNEKTVRNQPPPMPQFNQPTSSPKAIPEKNQYVCPQNTQSPCRGQQKSGQASPNAIPPNQRPCQAKPTEASIPMLELINRQKPDAPVGQNPPEDWYREREEYMFHDTFVPSTGYNRYRSQVESMVDKSLGASDVTYDNFRGGMFPKSSLDMSKIQARPPQTPEQASIPYERIRVSPLTPYIPQEASGSITPSSLLVPPDLDDMGNLSQYGAAGIAQLVSDMQENLDGAAPGLQMANAAADDADDVDGACVCVKNMLRNFKGKAFCVPPMDDYCADCGGFGPMWWAMCPCGMFY